MMEDLGTLSDQFRLNDEEQSEIEVSIDGLVVGDQDRG